MQTPRMLGLDIGDRRVGIAVTGALGMAQPLITMARSSLKQEVKNIARLIRKYDVAGIVAGNPLHMSGDVSPQAAKAAAYATALGDELHLPVYLQDERLSSTAAHELMDSLGFARGPGRKGKLDQYAAVVILQDWIDARERIAALEAGSAMHAPSL